MKLIFLISFLLIDKKEEAPMVIEPLIEAFIEFEGIPPKKCEDLRESPSFFMILKSNSGERIGCKNLKSKPIEGAGKNKWGILLEQKTKIINFYSEKRKIFSKPERQKWEKIPLGQSFARLLGKIKRIWKLEQKNKNPSYDEIKSFGGNLLARSTPHNLWENGTLEQATLEGDINDAFSRLQKKLPGWIIDMENEWIYEIRIVNKKAQMSFFSFD
tara:strand:- start:8925 stop:9569 length:645 start_codon:yes stop_codon:yes gene_type:complete